MNEAQVRTVEQVRQVLEGTQVLPFRAAQDDEGRYGWIEAVLRRLRYRQLQGPTRAHELMRRKTTTSRGSLRRLAATREVGGGQSSSTG